MPPAPPVTTATLPATCPRPASDTSGLRIGSGGRLHGTVCGHGSSWVADDRRSVRAETSVAEPGRARAGCYRTMVPLPTPNGGPDVGGAGRRGRHARRPPRRAAPDLQGPTDCTALRCRKQETSGGLPSSGRTKGRCGRIGPAALPRRRLSRRAPAEAHPDGELRLRTRSEGTAEAPAWAGENRDRAQSLENPGTALFRVGQSKFRRRKVSATFDRTGREEPWFEPALAPALAAMTERQRVAVVLVPGFDWTLREVAELMGVHVSSAQSHLERGLAKLRTAQARRRMTRRSRSTSRAWSRPGRHPTRRSNATACTSWRSEAAPHARSYPTGVSPTHATRMRSGRW